MHSAHMAEADFSQAPFTVIWEVTRACALACKHCRAEAQPLRHPLELNTEEGYRLIDQIKSFGNPIFVITGGDPMMRRDLPDLIRYAVAKGLRTSLTPSGTKLVTRERLQNVKEAGVLRLALSLDGSNAEIHDAFRKIPGTFARTMEIIRDIRDLGISFQINTTVSRYNVDDLPQMMELVKESGAVQWSLFFLVPTGRGNALDMVTPEQHERVFNWLYDLSKTEPFDIKSTAAQMYRRVVIQREREAMVAAAALPKAAGAEGLAPVSGSHAPGSHAPGQHELPVTVAGAGFQYKDGLNRPVKGVNDGNGFLFISHTGEIMPSGFLPIAAGNIREDSLVDVYRNAPLFKELRNPDLLKGRCGRCEFKIVCGGQRGRAYALTGDYLETDPACAYEP
ncbi:MAG: TIGR04053 family radical SAM/SPASM domain-containing protein [Symbiobacteriia bacterium]